MKQNINIEQIKELKDDVYVAFVSHMVEELGIVIWRVDGEQDNEDYLNAVASRITIGWMIEFLDEKAEDKYFPIKKDQEWYCGHEVGYGTSGKELCDALWEAVKEVLES